jgi:hypothetical protein
MPGTCLVRGVRDAPYRRGFGIEGLDRGDLYPPKLDAEVILRTRVCRLEAVQGHLLGGVILEHLGVCLGVHLLAGLQRGKVRLVVGLQRCEVLPLECGCSDTAPLSPLPSTIFNRGLKGADQPLPG